MNIQLVGSLNPVNRTNKIRPHWCDWGPLDHFILPWLSSRFSISFATSLLQHTRRVSSLLESITQMTFYFTLHTVLHFGLECSIIAATLRREGTTFSAAAAPWLQENLTKGLHAACGQKTVTVYLASVLLFPRFRWGQKLWSEDVMLNMSSSSTCSHTWVKVKPACAHLVYTECAWTWFHGLWKMLWPCLQPQDGLELPVGMSCSDMKSFSRKWLND